jgi:hypothetical protein
METYASFVHEYYDQLPTNIVFTPSVLDTHGRRARLHHLLGCYRDGPIGGGGGGGGGGSSSSGSTSESFDFDCASTNSWLQQLGGEGYDGRSFHRTSNFLSEEWYWSLDQHCAPPADTSGNDCAEDHNEHACHAVQLTVADYRPFGAWIAAHITHAEQTTAFQSFRDVPTCFNGLFRTSSQLLHNPLRPRKFYARIQEQLAVANDCEAVHFVERAVAVVFGGMRSDSKQAREMRERAITRNKVRVLAATPSAIDESSGEMKQGGGCAVKEEENDEEGIIVSCGEGRCSVEQGVIIGEGYFDARWVPSLQQCIQRCLQTQQQPPRPHQTASDIGGTSSGSLCGAFTFAAAGQESVARSGGGAGTESLSNGGACFLKTLEHATGIVGKGGVALRVRQARRISGMCIYDSP